MIFHLVHPSTRSCASETITLIKRSSFKTFDQNIVKFNMQEKEWYNEVVAFVENYENTLIHTLFRLYTKTCMCQEFITSLTNKKSKWKEGEDMLVEEFLDFAEKKHQKFLVCKEWKNTVPSTMFVSLLNNLVKGKRRTFLDPPITPIDATKHQLLNLISKLL